MPNIWPLFWHSVNGRNISQPAPKLSVKTNSSNKLVPDEYCHFYSCFYRPSPAKARPELKWMAKSYRICLYPNPRLPVKLHFPKTTVHLQYRARQKWWVNHVLRNLELWHFDSVFSLDLCTARLFQHIASSRQINPAWHATCFWLWRHNLDARFGSGHSSPWVALTKDMTSACKPSTTEATCLPEPPYDCLKLTACPVFRFQNLAEFPIIFLIEFSGQVIRDI